MSIQERNSTSNPPDAAETERVTAQELTMALERIEAGKQAESRRLSSTIALGEAVRELGLEVTPEEIFAEVQRQRRLAQTTPTEHLPKVKTPDADRVGEVWPPPPASQNPVPEAPKADVTHCPACARKLLTQTSAVCNWCGAVINDPKYQAYAAEIRHVRDKTAREQIDSIAEEEARYGVLGRLKKRAKQHPGGTPMG
jgi:hypothetical protein